MTTFIKAVMITLSVMAFIVFAQTNTGIDSFLLAVVLGTILLNAGVLNKFFTIVLAVSMFVLFGMLVVAKGMVMAIAMMTIVAVVGLIVSFFIQPLVATWKEA